MPDVVLGTRESCSCPDCQAACQHKPGWFKPGEAEKVAAYLNLSLEELFKTKLGVDWWEADPMVFLLAPATTTMEPGHEYPGNPRGQCIFYKDGLCEIHAVKPFECARMMHDDGPTHDGQYHREAKDAWDSPEAQALIRTLLGREPESESFTIFDDLFGAFPLPY